MLLLLILTIVPDLACIPILYKTGLSFSGVNAPIGPLSANKSCYASKGPSTCPI